MGHRYDMGWNTKPKLDEARSLAPETPRTHRARKDRRRWCRGKVGVEHDPVLRMSKNSEYFLARYGSGPHAHCGWHERHAWEWIDGARVWTATGEWSYRCHHERGCRACGKILDHSWTLPSRECPEWKPRDAR